MVQMRAIPIPPMITVSIGDPSPANTSPTIRSTFALASNTGRNPAPSSPTSSPTTGISRPMSSANCASH